MAPALTKEQQTELQKIKQQFKEEITEENNYYSVILDSLLRIQYKGEYDEKAAVDTIDTILNLPLDISDQNKWLKALKEKSISRCSVFSIENLDKLSKLKDLTAEHLNLIIEHNDDVSPEFCKTIINRFWPNSITGVNIKDAIEGSIEKVSIENLKKIVDKASLTEEQLKNLVSKLFTKKDDDLGNQEKNLQICKNIIVENKNFDATVADVIITKINQVNNPTLTTNKGELLKDVLEKLLNKSDKDLSKLVAKLCATEDINDTNKSDILNTIINHEKLTAELAEILLKQYADSINKEQLEKIIGVMGNNPSIIKIIFSNPNTRELIGELNDETFIKLLNKAEKTTDLNTILTAKLETNNKPADKNVSISEDVADNLVKKICEIYNKTIPPTPPTKPTFFESFIQQPVRTFFESIRDAFPPATERKQCKEMLGKIYQDDDLLKKLSQHYIKELIKLAPTNKILENLTSLFPKARTTATSPVDIPRTKDIDESPQPIPTIQSKPPTNGVATQTGGNQETVEGEDSPQPLSTAKHTLEQKLGELGGFKATASDSGGLDSDNPKVPNGQQLDYDKFIKQIGSEYTGTKSDTTFKIYSQNDTEKENTLMEKKADGSLVFRKEFGEEDAKLFLESIKSLAETSAATPEEKLQLQMANFTEKQLECIRTLVAKEDTRGATPYNDLLNKVTFTSGEGTKVDLQTSQSVGSTPTLSRRPTAPQAKGKP